MRVMDLTADLGLSASRAEPDEGEVNYAGLLEMIDGSGYTGWVACEYKPRARTEEGLSWARAYGIAAPA